MSRKIMRLNLDRDIKKYEFLNGPILGIQDNEVRNCFIEQLVESIHRVEYVKTLTRRGVDPVRCDTSSTALFNPLLAAIYKKNQGDINESFWLIFLFTLFGKGRGDIWRFSRELYGKLEQGDEWNWLNASTNTTALIDWISENIDYLSRSGTTFGNHRKYENWHLALETIKSYISWVGVTKDHSDIVGNAIFEAKGDPKIAFDILYKSMDKVYRFGRMAKFDYLTMISKVGLADIEPGYVYVAQATGPLVGGRILFGDINMPSRQLEQKFSALADDLSVNLQVMEDAVCNWQKSPDQFVAYRI